MTNLGSKPLFITRFSYIPGIEYETSTNDVEIKVEDEKTNDSESKAKNGISNMLCGVLCKSRLEDVINENEKRSNDDTKNSTSKGIFRLNVAPFLSSCFQLQSIHFLDEVQIHLFHFTL